MGTKKSRSADCLQANGKKENLRCRVQERPSRARGTICFNRWDPGRTGLSGIGIQMIVQKAKTVERAQAGRIYLRIPVLLLTGLLTTNGCQSIQDLFQPTEETGDYNFPW